MSCDVNWKQTQDFANVVVRNLIQIEINLCKLGYKFANPRGAIVPNLNNENRALRKLSEAYGVLPTLFTALYERVEYVDFTQDSSQLMEPNDDLVAGLGLNCTLVFGSLDTLQERQEALTSSGWKCMNLAGNVFIPFGSYASNSTPKGVWLPDGATDPTIYDAGAGAISLGNEIRSSIRAGGFPFWKQMFAKRRFTSPIKNVPNYRVILPLLLEGITPI